MADISKLEAIVAEYRERMVTCGAASHIGRVAEYDAMTMLLLAAIEELREIKQIMQDRPHA